MKNYFFIFLFTLSTLNYRAQTNLVPNPSFEDTLQCPFNPAQIAFSPPWYDPTNGSSDYFNNCNGSNYGVPNNIVGFQLARTGKAYAGLYTYIPGFNYREYIQVQLLSKLSANTSYCVDFYISLADTFNIGANNIGAYFSDTAISGIFGQVLNVVPQINNDISINSLNDKVGWIKISGSFMANGNESFVTIGSFVDDISTDTIHIAGGSYPQAYYYIDDVSVICCDCIDSVSVFIPNIFSPNNDNQNDYIDFSNLDLVEEIVDIYNRWGNIVFQSSVTNTKWDGRDLKGNDCSEGVYYYVFHYAEFINKEIDRKGFIQLVR